MKRARWPWLVFGACALAGALAVGFMSVTTLRLERAEADTRARAALEENARLALWRMDLSLARLIALEASRPVAAYEARQPGDDPRVLVHFEATATGGLGAGEAVPRLDAVRSFLRDAAPAPQVVALGNTRGANEFNFRNRFAQQNLNNAEPFAPTPGLVPTWLGDWCSVNELVLLRRVTRPTGAVTQGALLDWPVLQAQLLDDVRDLLPNAMLEPVRTAGPAEEWQLASLPVRLVPGAVPPPPAPPQMPAWLVLTIAWAGALAAMLALGVLLFGTLSLGERRAAFVSAVTHELRTPLTTFRMYSEMLEQDMVPAEQRKEYLGTLRREADRLGYLVENVLAWARLEGRGAKPAQPVALESVLAQVVPRLRERAAQAGMTLEVGELPDAKVLAEPISVEQVLFNLIDNTAKYAAGATDRRIHLELALRPATVELKVRDHGPGVPAEVARRLFEPFAKSAARAADTALGIGLGLALSRRLARSMGGDLALGSGPGAQFVLSLKRVTNQ